MGLIMFTKFFLGIHKVLTRGIKDKPLSFALMAGLQYAVADVDDITEQSLITKNYSGIIHNPFDIISTVADLPLLQLPSRFGDAITGIAKN